MTIDPSDVQALKVFFEKHRFYTTYELAMLVNKSPSTIDKWRHKCNMTTDKQHPPIKPRVTNSPTVQIVPKTIWDDAAWLRQKYEIEKLGMPTIAQMIGRSVTLVKRKLEKYGIITRTLQTAMQSRNPLCNATWLMLHYVNNGETIEECARLAGVSSHTIYKWLVKFKISIRDINEAMAGERNPFWGRRHSAETKEKLRRAYKASGNPYARSKRADSAAASI